MITLHTGDCLTVMATMEPNSVDTIISDPPYGLSFMGKSWDHGVPGVPFWEAALRVAKPGATMLAFGGTRTVHRLTVAIEDAGWEIRDSILWLYGSGFPKSHNISKALDKAAGAEREVVGVSKYANKGRTTSNNVYSKATPSDNEAITAPATDATRTWDGYGTALKPAHEPIIVAMKPLDGTFANNALTHGVAGLWIDGGRVGTEERNGEYASPSRRWPANLIHDGSDEATAGFPVTGGDKRGRQNGARPGGFGNVGAENGDGKPVSDLYADTGSAARYFYCAKSSRAERNAGLDGMPEQVTDDGRLTPNDTAYQRGKTKRQNSHPCCKPIALMRYLAKLTRTPTGGIVLDPFMGSGSTGVACVHEGRDFVGIELDSEYVEIARRRIEHAETEAQAAADLAGLQPMMDFGDEL